MTENTATFHKIASKEALANLRQKAESSKQATLRPAGSKGMDKLKLSILSEEKHPHILGDIPAQRLGVGILDSDTLKNPDVSKRRNELKAKINPRSNKPLAKGVVR